MTAPLVELSGVSFSYGSEAVLRDIGLTVNRGDFVAVIGPNGGGKTTLIKLVLGLLAPDVGVIRVCGQPPGAIGGLVGYVPQYIDHNHSFPATALDVVRMGLFRPDRRVAGLFSRQRRQVKKQALDTLARLGIAELAGRRISALSGGQRQRVLIARALAAAPELLILDEPTASLDTRAQNDFFELLSEINRECTVLVVSHDLLVIASYAKSVACVNRTLHYHDSIRSSGELMEAFYASVAGEAARCPVEHLRQRFPALNKEMSPHV